MHYTASSCCRWCLLECAACRLSLVSDCSPRWCKMSGHIQTLFCASYDCQNKCVVCLNQAIIGKKKDTYLSLQELRQSVEMWFWWDAKNQMQRSEGVVVVKNKHAIKIPIINDNKMIYCLAAFEDNHCYACAPFSGLSFLGFLWNNKHKSGGLELK